MNSLFLLALSLLAAVGVIERTNASIDAAVASDRAANAKEQLESATVSPVPTDRDGRIATN